MAGIAPRVRSVIRKGHGSGRWTTLAAPASENLGHLGGPMPYTTRKLVVFPAPSGIRGVVEGSFPDARTCGVQPGVLWVKGSSPPGGRWTQ